jgi:CO/xanthine dehydrogenase Mo-binding subunit
MTWRHFSNNWPIALMAEAESGLIAEAESAQEELAQELNSRPAKLRLEMALDQFQQPLAVLLEECQIMANLAMAVDKETILVDGNE